MILKDPPDKQSDSDDDTNVKKEKLFTICFKQINGSIKCIPVNQEHSIGTAIKKYLVSIGIPELIFDLSEGNDKLIFIARAKKIQINDKTKIKDFFEDDNSRVIMVNDPGALIGA